MKRIAIFSILLLFTQYVKAQTDTVNLDPVEVRATRASKTAPFAKTNLSRSAIEKQNLGQDLPFMLNQTPSVIVNSDAGNGVGYTGIRIRGTDATRINVTLNGIPFNDAESNGTFFVNLPDFLSSVSSIQVQRGVGTSSNGPGAFGATINLSTHELNKNAYAEFNNAYGSFNTLKNTVKVGTGLLGQHFTLDARASRISSDGYIDRANSDLKSLYLSTAYLAEKTNIRFTAFSGKEKTYQAWYGVSESDLQENRTINYAGMEKPGEPYDNETDNYQQDHYQFFFDRKLSDRLVFNTGFFYVKGKGYYEQYKAEEEYADYGITPPDPNRTQTDLVRRLWLDNDYYGNVFSFLYKHIGTDFTLGGALSNYTGDHFGEIVWAEQGLNKDYNWYDVPAEKKDFNVYSKWQQQLNENFSFFTDVQYRNVKYSLDGFRDNPSINIQAKYNFINPKLGFSFSKHNWFGYASYAVANKEPNRDDFEAGANEQPRPERLNDIELGIQKKAGKYSIAAGIYYMHYKDQLVLTGKINDVGAYTRTNIDKSYRTGVELELSTKISGKFYLSANATFSRNKIQDFVEFIDDYDVGGQQEIHYGKTDISFSPSAIAGLNLGFLPIPNLELGLFSKYVSKQYLDNTSNESRKLNPYFTQDIKAIYSFNKNILRKVDIMVQVNNVFNTFYEPNGYTFSYVYNNKLSTENYYFPMAGTNWMLGLNIHL